MKISSQEIKKIAELARLRMTEAEAEDFGDQLSRIVGYVEQLHGVDTAEVSGTAWLQRSAPLADDVVRPSERSQVLLAGAPLEQDGQIKVRSVFD